MADRCLLFEPDTVSSRKFLEAVAPRLQASLGNRAQRARHRADDSETSFSDEDDRPPFELECLEAAFLVAIGWLAFSIKEPITVIHSGKLCSSYDISPGKPCILTCHLP